MQMKTPKLYLRYWGKASKDASEVNFHLLPYHCLDVVAVADVWLSRSSILLSQASQQTGLSEDETRRIILFFIALHDLGKFDARFQEFVPALRLKLQGSDHQVCAESYNHGSYGYAHFQKEFFSSENMLTVAGHHGSCDKTIRYFEPDADEALIQQDRQARKEWVEHCLAWFELSEVPQVSSISILAGLCSVSDWIGSSMTNFTESVVDLDDYYQNALPRATEALAETGLLSSIQGAGFDYLFSDYSPRGIQKLIPSLPVQAGLTIVESDTGSGKTEFALSYASLLVQKGLADGIVFGLPTQATANGLFDRVGESASKLFPDCDTTLAHSKSKYLIPDENGFLHQSSKRAFLGSMSVATVDQILMGVLGIKHQFIRSFGTQKSVLILDEIHSFDAYMYGLITKVLSGQHNAFSSVILLSATLPPDLKEKLLETYGGGCTNDDAYPLVTHVSLDGESKTFTADSTAKKVVEVDLWESLDLLPSDSQCKQLIDWVSEGATVGVICNTVQDAQLLYSRIIEQAQGAINIDLFHARFALEDRLRIEKGVLKKYGKHAKRQGRLLIATQVVEQSLDLDFDVLVSQIAPIEFLMQRMGRLWRHDRSIELSPRSPAIKAPLFITLCPPLGVVEKNYSSYQGSGYVYKDIRVLYRTQKYLTQRRSLSFPGCYREAINLIHSNENYVDEAEELVAIAEAFAQAQEGSFVTAKRLSNQASKPLKDVDPRCALLTREGEMSQSVVLFKNGQLLHGGDYSTQSDRERSTVSLSRKLAKGKLDPDLHCLKAVVGSDISYSDLGVFDQQLQQKIERTRS